MFGSGGDHLVALQAPDSMMAIGSIAAALFKPLFRDWLGAAQTGVVFNLLNIRDCRDFPYFIFLN